MTSDVHSTSAGWVQRTHLPVLTVGVFLVLALVFWINAALNRYRFNVAIAVLATVPLLLVLLRAALKGRHAGNGRRPSPTPHDDVAN